MKKMVKRSLTVTPTASLQQFFITAQKSQADTETPTNSYILHILYYNIIRTYRKIGLVHEKSLQIQIILQSPSVVLYPPRSHHLFQIMYPPKPTLVYSWNSLMKCTHTKVSARTLIFTFNRETTI